VKQEYIAGLDIGTTKICTVIVRASGGEMLDIAGVGTVPARGVSKGTVVDLKQAALSITESVQAASHMAGFAIDRALVGVTGTHVEAENRRGAVTVGAAQNESAASISEKDIARAFESAAIRVAPDREILHLVPRSFALDGQRGIASPLGMNASRLEAEIHLVTAASNSLKNVIDCTHRAGIEAQALVLEPIATSEAVCSPDERALGVAIIDIGGGTSDIAVFCDGALHSSVIVPVGGNHVTRDISIGLRTPFEIAERLKIESGGLTASPKDKEQTLEIVSAGGGERTKLPRAVLAKIIAPRMTELFEMARDAMHCDDIRRQLPSGIILTGGGALLPGAVALAQQVFGLPVRLGQPVGVAGWADRVNSPKFSTAVGLLQYARRLQREDYAFANLPGNGDATTRIWGVPLDIAAAPLQQEEAPVAEAAADIPAAAVPTPGGAELSKNIAPAVSQNWQKLSRALQPLLDRLRKLLGLDVE